MTKVVQLSSNEIIGHSIAGRYRLVWRDSIVIGMV